MKASKDCICCKLRWELSQGTLPEPIGRCFICDYCLKYCQYPIECNNIYCADCILSELMRAKKPYDYYTYMFGV